MGIVEPEYIFDPCKQMYRKAEKAQEISDAMKEQAMAPAIKVRRGQEERARECRQERLDGNTARAERREDPQEDWELDVEAIKKINER